jgi:hypothetical protein
VRIIEAGRRAGSLREGLDPLLTWGRLHGQTSLEVFGHHHWILPDGCERLYRADVEAILAEVLLPPGAAPG